MATSLSSTRGKPKKKENPLLQRPRRQTLLLAPLVERLQISKGTKQPLLVLAGGRLPSVGLARFHLLPVRRPRLQFCASTREKGTATQLGFCRHAALPGLPAVLGPSCRPIPLLRLPASLLRLRPAAVSPRPETTAAPPTSSLISSPTCKESEIAGPV